MRQHFHSIAVLVRRRVAAAILPLTSSSRRNMVRAAICGALFWLSVSLVGRWLAPPRPSGPLAGPSSPTVRPDLSRPAAERGVPIAMSGAATPNNRGPSPEQERRLTRVALPLPRGQRQTPDKRGAETSPARGFTPKPTAPTMPDRVGPSQGEPRPWREEDDATQLAADAGIAEETPRETKFVPTSDVRPASGSIARTAYQQSEEPSPAVRPKPAAERESEGQSPEERPAPPPRPQASALRAEGQGSAAGSRSAASGGGPTAAGGDPRNPATVGVAPPKEQPEFLRQNSVLLKPGEYQTELGVYYMFNSSNTVLALANNNSNFVGDLTRIQRLLMTTVDLRVGVTPELQMSAQLPFGWSNGQLVFAGQDEVSNAGGIGDIGFGLTKLFQQGDANHATILGNLSATAPTGNANFASSLVVPGSTLGQGFWTTTLGLTFIRTLDPIVLFAGFGYQHRFDAEVAPDVSLSPGAMAFYRFGAGYAINSRVTLNGSFNGAYISDFSLNDRRVAGSAREPMQLRIAATIARGDKGANQSKLRTVEPFLTWGLTDSAPDCQFGINWSY